MTKAKRLSALLICIVIFATSIILPVNASSSVNFVRYSGLVCTKNEENYSTTHASTVVALDGGICLCAWFGGSGEGEDDVRIWYSISENGAWSEPQKVPDEENVAHWNPVLQKTETGARIYFKVGEDTENWVTKVADFDLATRTWSESKELVPGDTTGGRGPAKNKCIETSKGLLIAPASTENGTWRCFFDISTDGGKTWTKTDYVVAKKSNGKTVEMIQPTLWEDKDGVVHALFRTKVGKIYKSDSYDGGYTWCNAYATSLPNNNSGIDCVVTDNGWVWLCYNPISTAGIRNKLALAVSKDNGNTWETVTMLEKDALLWREYSYPSIIASGNLLLITYTYRRDRIKCAVISFEG